jgi:hypothetical protein
LILSDRIALAISIACAINQIVIVLGIVIVIVSANNKMCIYVKIKHTAPRVAEAPVVAKKSRQWYTLWRTVLNSP